MNLVHFNLTFQVSKHLFFLFCFVRECIKIDSILKLCTHTHTHKNREVKSSRLTETLEGGKINVSCHEFSHSGEVVV